MLKRAFVLLMVAIQASPDMIVDMSRSLWARTNIFEGCWIEKWPKAPGVRSRARTRPEWGVSGSLWATRCRTCALSAGHRSEHANPSDAASGATWSRRAQAPAGFRRPQSRAEPRKEWWEVCQIALYLRETSAIKFLHSNFRSAPLGPQIIGN